MRARLFALLTTCLAISAGTLIGCSESSSDDRTAAPAVGTVSVTEFGLTEGCHGMQFRATVTQGADKEEPDTVSIVAIEAGSVALGTFGGENSLNPEEEMTITLMPATIVGDCGSFKAGNVWEFTGTPNKTGDGLYTVKFADFSKR